MNSNFQEVLSYLYGLLPMYQRVGNSAIKKNLDNTIALCKHYGDPHLKFKSIHIAGTNGKGSVSHMLSSVLQEAGYHTGLYTSPHLKSFTERIRVNGLNISEEYVIDFVESSKAIIEKVEPSFFELTVAMAFKYFADSRVDLAVVEVGLGGRLDSTNVIHPLVSLITNIGLDHAEMLGDTLEKIAFEKAGIIKQGTPVVISERQETISNVFLEQAGNKKADLYFAGDELQCKNVRSEIYRLKFDLYKCNQLMIEGLVTDLAGKYQVKNVPGVIKVLELLPQEFSVSKDEIRKGLGKVVVNTGLKGRWQILQESPLVICDTGHNVEGITEVVRNLSETPYHKLYLILGMVKEKDCQKILELLPKEANYYYCEPDIPRMQSAVRLNEVARSIGREGGIIPDVNEALDFVLQKANKDDLIFIGGSNFVIAELKNL